MQNNNNKSNNNQAIWKCKYLPWRLIQLTAIHKHPLPFLKWLTSLLPPVSLRFLCWLKWLFACLVCSPFLSVYLSVYFPLVLSVCSAKMYTLLHSTSIVIQIRSLVGPEKQTNQKTSLETNLVKSSTENAGRTDRLSMGSLSTACSRHCLHSPSDNYLHITYMHM